MDVKEATLIELKRQNDALERIATALEATGPVVTEAAAAICATVRAAIEVATAK